MTSLSTVGVESFSELPGESRDLIDVRTPAEFVEVHAQGARNIPLDTLDPKSFDASRPLYVICRSGTRATKAAERLLASGFTNVFVVDGGTDAWIAAGLPVVRGRKAISLERQVRIVAGGIALIGSLLSLTVHPWFAGIPAFIGAGLLYAGLSDTCGMAMVLARMPWNRRDG